MGGVRFTVSLLIVRFATLCPNALRLLRAYRVAIKSERLCPLRLCENLSNSSGNLSHSSGCASKDVADANVSAHGQSKQSEGETRLQQEPSPLGRRVKAFHHHSIVGVNPLKTDADTVKHHPIFFSVMLLTCAVVGCTSGLVWMYHRKKALVEKPGHTKAIPEAAFQGCEWCNAERLLYALEPANDLGIKSLPPPWTADTTREVLESNGIDAHAWSESELAELSNQLSSGLLCLVRDNTGVLQIRVDIVQVILSCPRDWLVLQVECPSPDNSDIGECREQDLEGRMHRKETLWESALRCLHEQLGAQNLDVKCDSMANVIENEESNSVQYPGVSTVTRRYKVHISVTSSTRAALDQSGLGSQHLKDGGRTYKWVPMESHEMPTAWVPRPLRDFGTAILPWNVAAVQSMLNMHGVIDPVESFGRTFEDLSCALSAGKLSLGVVSTENRLMCVMEEVSLLITSMGGQVLASPSCLRMLPTTVKCSNENVHMAAFRLLQQVFGVNAPLAEIEKQTVVTDKLAAYKGHVTRTILMFAKMSVPLHTPPESAVGTRVELGF